MPDSTQGDAASRTTPAGCADDDAAAATASPIALALGPPSHEFLANPFISVHLDGISAQGRLSGWMVDLSTPDQPASVVVSVDGTALGGVLGDRPRPDVIERGDAGFACGFEFDLPPHLFDGRPHVLEVKETAGTALGLHYDGEIARSCIMSGLIVGAAPVLRSHVDGMEAGMIGGWVLRGAAGSTALAGGCSVLATCRGIEVGRLTATLPRHDVALGIKGDARCGFRLAVPDGVERSGRATFRFFLLPEMVELEGSPLQVSFMRERERRALDTILQEIDRLHVELTRLRRRAHALLPRDAYTLESYDAWARRYLPALRRRVRDAQAAGAGTPLVSVVMPVYRPVLTDFLAAVRSVQEQSYPRWELVIVDDASLSRDLSRQLATLEAADRRIRVLTQARNGGISRATNAAIAAARGEWIAFLDHDDVLVDVALQAMVQATADGTARMLYSDEDKIDADGVYSDPAFKPDWNHRLMLGVNYVCHLLMVEARTLREAGPLDPRHDGAQDHGLVLRLSERIDAGAIRHVPEVLYHWRKTASSTAVDTANKPYARQAGVLAVSEHLARLGRPASVTSLRDTTFYRVAWECARSPTVTIVIPYRDRVAMTRECVERVLSRTDYARHDVLLVDNWSSSAEAAAFAREMSGRARVRVLRIEEEFNYSRLNNAAVEHSDAEFLVFMNNDLFVEREDWLRVLVNEAVVDARVGIVGGKFVYPDRTVQHGGVVVGLGGVAGHVHSHIAEHEPGYGARAILAQELSAVTAAAMLVRADVFRAVGGFDERDLPVAFNDVDLCLKVRRAGWRIVWTPDFVAEHRESISRGRDDHPDKEGRVFHEVQTMLERWDGTLDADPFYSRWFAREGTPFHDLAEPAGGDGASAAR